ncbi:hypothetical protein MRX96_002366 [Rhipicephalus microplus]
MALRSQWRFSDQTLTILVYRTSGNYAIAAKLHSAASLTSSPGVPIGFQARCKLSSSHRGLTILQLASSLVCKRLWRT